MINQEPAKACKVCLPSYVVGSWVINVYSAHSEILVSIKNIQMKQTYKTLGYFKHQLHEASKRNPVSLISNLQRLMVLI